MSRPPEYAKTTFFTPVEASAMTRTEVRIAERRTGAAVRRHVPRIAAPAKSAPEMATSRSASSWSRSKAARVSVFGCIWGRKPQQCSKYDTKT